MKYSIPWDSIKIQADKEVNIKISLISQNEDVLGWGPLLLKEEVQLLLTNITQPMEIITDEKD